MKRLLACTVALLLMLTVFAACGGDSGSGAPATDNNAAPTDNAGDGDSNGDAAGDGGESGESVRVYLIMAQRDEFLSTMEGAATSAASSRGDVEFSVADAQSDTNKMIQFVETARNGGYDAVIVNLVDPNNAPEVIDAAGDMKVVFVNRYPTDESVFNENVAYVGSDEMTSGKFQGEFLAEHFAAQGKTEISYIMLNGIMGQTSTINRTASALKALEDAGITATEATAPLACDFDRATAMDKISPLIGTTEFDCIISNNDAMALGAIEALEAKDVDPSTLPIVGIDATADGRQAIKEGKMSMSVFQDPVGQGAGSLQAAVNLVLGNALNEGTSFEVDASGSILWVPFEPVTPDNVDSYDNR